MQHGQVQTHESPPKLFDSELKKRDFGNRRACVSGIVSVTGLYIRPLSFALDVPLA